MTKTFRVLAFLVAGLVVVQAAVMVWGIAGLGIWLDKDGGELTSQTPSRTATARSPSSSACSSTA